MAPSDDRMDLPSNTADHLDSLIMDSKTPTMSVMHEAHGPVVAMIGGSVLTWLSLIISASSQINPLLQTIALLLGITASICTIRAGISKRNRAKRRKLLQ